jgi:hypothetical protein
MAGPLALLVGCRGKLAAHAGPRQGSWAMGGEGLGPQGKEGLGFSISFLFLYLLFFSSF